MGFLGRIGPQPMRGYLNLEDGTPNGRSILIPNGEFRAGAPMVGGCLGNMLGPPQGSKIFEFVRALISHLEDNYCINTNQIFATGQSWGGDMSHVLACFVGDKVRAAVPVAANTYWFTQNSGGRVECVGGSAVWTMFGQADDAFPNQPIKVPMRMNRTFWTEEMVWDRERDLGLGQVGECGIHGL